ncbi:MAG: Uma2 family endonuclease, partial [Cyanobacteria bacterium P01_F01_bin.4]
MVQAILQPVTFNEFIEWYPDKGERRYELHRGVIVEMPKPKGKHSKIAGFLNGSLFTQIQQASRP